MNILTLSPRFATLGDRFYSTPDAEPLPNPRLAAYSPDAAELVCLPRELDDVESFIQTFNGERKIGDYTPLSAVYSGHQFGYYVPQLGDGRALMIAEANGYEIQLKGSGKTPYSRFGDGKAVLRSCIREFLCSEAMAALGIPTTRALCIIGSDEPVQRERVETAAMLTRISPSHIRFGSFEYFYYTQDYDALRLLADFCIEHYFHDARKAKNPYAAMLHEVCIRTAELIAGWQCVGFAHGVMNTDNMSILGLTLDYGPFGFQDAFNAHFICNHSDEAGRYAFDQQPLVGLWNLNALARALSPLIAMEDIKPALQAYEPAFIAAFEAGMRVKLGLPDADAAFIQNTLRLLHEHRVDYTLFFRRLTDEQGILPALFPPTGQEAIEEWLDAYDRHKNRASQESMRRANPKYILRNYLAETAIRKAESGDYSEVAKLHAILRRPFDDQPEYESYATTPPDWAAGICVSCSS